MPEAKDLDWSNAVVIYKNPLGIKGQPMPIGRNHGGLTVMSFKSFQMTGGATNDKKAKWRKGRGLNRGQVNMKMLKGKTAK